MRLNTMIFAGALATFGCTTSDDTTVVEPPPVSDGLTMHQETPEHVRGTYHDAELDLTLSFESARVDEQVYLELRGNHGRHLVTIDTRGNEYVMSYLGGKLVMTVTRDQLMANADAEDPEAQLAGIDMRGDEGALDELLNAPEMVILPIMSRTLGARGLTGMSHPASLSLHKMARQTADGLGIEVEALEVSDNDEVPACSRPRANNCYGMCGPGCSCWSWVCGNCCWHRGCAKHDSWCRQGKWYYCYNISAVVALFGC